MCVISIITDGRIGKKEIRKIRTRYRKSNKKLVKLKHITTKNDIPKQ